MKIIMFMMLASLLKIQNNLLKPNLFQKTLQYLKFLLGLKTVLVLDKIQYNSSHALVIWSLGTTKKAKLLNSKVTQEPC